jgi:drug/metabolite transporter (DMT)-like permease
MAWGLMAAAALTFAGAFLGMFVGVRLIGASGTAMIMNLEPVLTIVLAIVLLDENLTVHQFLGAALVVAAVFAAQIGSRTDAKL